MKTLNLILPCYNPPKYWVETLIQSYHLLNDTIKDVQIHFTLVDDGSKISEYDHKHLLTSIKNLTIYSYSKNYGKGYALRYGVQHAPESDYYILTDIDFPFEMRSTLGLIQRLIEGNVDLLLGHRTQETYYETVPLLRRWISKWFRVVVKQLLGNGITDTQCGLKGFSKQAKPYFLKTTINRYLFDLEFIILVKRASKLEISTFPVVLKEGIIFRNMGIGILSKELFNFFRLLIKF